MVDGYLKNTFYMPLKEENIFLNTLLCRVNVFLIFDDTHFKRPLF